MTKNGAAVHGAAASIRSAFPAGRAAIREWLGKPGGAVRVWIKLAVAVLLIALLLSFVDWRESLLLLGDVKLLPASYALGLLALGITLSTIKWQVLLTAHKIRLPFVRLLRYYWIGTFFSNFLPSNVGGDVIRLMLSYSKGNLTIIGASILIERLTGFFILLCLAALGLCMRAQYFAQGGVLLPLCVYVIVLAAALIVIVYLAVRIGLWLPTPPESGHLLAGIVLIIVKMARALAYYNSQIKAVLLAIGISTVFYISMIAFQYNAITAIGADISLLDVMFIVPLITLVSFIPVSVNAIGLAEGAFVLFFTQAGLSPEAALAAAVLRRVLILGCSLVGGVAWLWEQPRFRSVP